MNRGLNIRWILHWNWDVIIAVVIAVSISINFIRIPAVQFNFISQIIHSAREHVPKNENDGHYVAWIKFNSKFLHLRIPVHSHFSTNKNNNTSVFHFVPSTRRWFSIPSVFTKYASVTMEQSRTGITKLKLNGVECFPRFVTRVRSRPNDLTSCVSKVKFLTIQ